LGPPRIVPCELCVCVCVCYDFAGGTRPTNDKFMPHASPAVACFGVVIDDDLDTRHWRDVAVCSSVGRSVGQSVGRRGQPRMDRDCMGEHGSAAEWTRNCTFTSCMTISPAQAPSFSVSSQGCQFGRNYRQEGYFLKLLAAKNGLWRLRGHIQLFTIKLVHAVHDNNNNTG